LTEFYKSLACDVPGIYQKQETHADVWSGPRLIAAAPALLVIAALVRIRLGSPIFSRRHARFWAPVPNREVQNDADARLQRFPAA
jgi:hypothetical protein